MQRSIIEVKAGEDGAFSGILSTYGNIDSVGDVCEAGCYDRTVKERGTKRPLLWQHCQEDPIGSLEITSTEGVLAVDGRINLGVSKGRDAYALLKAGDIDGLSIGYIARDYDYDGDGVRHLKDVDLLEGSLVTIPANDLARAQAKAGRLDRMSRYARMESLKGLTEDQRKAVLAELDGIKVGDVDEDGNEVVAVIDAPLPGEAKADDEDEDEEEPGKEDSEDEDDSKAADEDDDDEVEKALEALSAAVARLKERIA